jgi:asparagine synthase (glutamine-hydrolysing)
VRALKWLNRYYRHDNQFPAAVNLQNLARKQWQARILTDTACKQFDIEQRTMQQAKFDSHCNSVNELILNDRWSPLMTARLENCTLTAARHGLEYRWPLLDIRLLKLYLSMPPEQKLGPRGISRYIHRRAVSNSIPASVTWKGKSMGQFVRSEAGLSQPVQIEQPRKALLPFDDLHSSLTPLIDESRLAELISNCKHNNAIAIAAPYNRVLNQLNNLQRWLNYNSDQS